jgi:HEAT repeat protein
LPQATVTELVAVKRSKADTATKQLADRELAKRWMTAGVLELLETIESVEDDGIRQTALGVLEQKNPKYADVKDDLEKIIAMSTSSNKQLAEAARSQLVNAFLRAPVPECFDWIARGDATLDKVIWQQLDDRIARADATRKAGYRDAALETLGDKSAKVEARAASIELLARVKDREAVGPVIELLLAMPQDLRPRAGKLLKDLTGQNFGPMPGDGSGEVTVAARKWRTWWKDNGGK